MALDPREWLTNLFGKKGELPRLTAREVDAPRPDAPAELTMSALQMASTLAFTRDFLADRKNAVAGVGWARLQRMPGWAGVTTVLPSGILSRATWSGMSRGSGGGWSVVHRTPGATKEITDFVRRRARLYRYTSADTASGSAEMWWPPVETAAEDGVSGVWDTAPANAVIRRRLQEVWGKREPADLPVAAQRRSVRPGLPPPLEGRMTWPTPRVGRPEADVDIVRQVDVPAKRVVAPGRAKESDAATVKIDNPIKKTWRRLVASLQKGKKDEPVEMTTKSERVAGESATVELPVRPAGEKERDVLEQPLSGAEKAAAVQQVHRGVVAGVRDRGGEQVSRPVSRQRSQPETAGAVLRHADEKSGSDEGKGRVSAEKEMAKETERPTGTAVAPREVPMSSSPEIEAVEMPVVELQKANTVGAGENAVSLNDAPSVEREVIGSPQQENTTAKMPWPRRKREETVKAVEPGEVVSVEQGMTMPLRRKMDAAPMPLVVQRAGEATVAGKRVAAIGPIGPPVSERAARPGEKKLSIGASPVKVTLRRAVEAKAAWGRNIARKYSAIFPLAAENERPEWPNFTATAPETTGSAVSALLLRYPTAGVVAETVQRVRATVSDGMPAMPLVAPVGLQRESAAPLARETEEAPLPGAISAEAPADRAGAEATLAAEEVAEKPAWPDLESLTDEIFRRLSWRLRLERERRGF